jgi:hypothetical protein
VDGKASLIATAFPAVGEYVQTSVLAEEAELVQVNPLPTGKIVPALMVYSAVPTAESVYVASVAIAFTVCVVETVIGVE